MRSTITVQQLHHFSQFGWIEFEHFLSQDECTKLFSHLEQVIAKRMSSSSVTRLSRQTSSKLYLTARDSFRDDSFLKQLFSAGTIPQTMADLIHKQTLQLACDQWIPAHHALPAYTLSSLCSLQDLSGGVLIKLTGAEAGNTRFFHPDRLPLFLEPKTTRSDDAQLLIAYGHAQTVYIHNPLDPSNGFLKTRGYQFGDRINPQQHPLCKIKSSL